MEKAIASRATAMMADIVARDNVTALQGILVTLSLSSSDFLGYFLYNYTTTQTRSLAAGSLLRLPEIPLTQTLDVLSTVGTAIFTGIRLFGHTHGRSLATVSPKKKLIRSLCPPLDLHFCVRTTYCFNFTLQPVLQNLTWFELLTFP